MEISDKIKMDILLNVMNLSIHSRITKIVFLISVKVAPIQPAAFSIFIFQRAHHIHLISEKLGCGQKCGKHAHWSGCASICRDVPTCDEPDKDYLGALFCGFIYPIDYTLWRSVKIF